jgi:hypothetical protein
MKVRICPNCGKHNPEDTWNCANCGETLSMNTLADVEHLPEPSSAGTPRKDPSEPSQEIIVYQSADAFISNRQIIIAGESFRPHQIASVEVVISDARQLPPNAKGERNPRAEDVLFGAGLMVRSIRSLTGIGMKRYTLRMHLRRGRTHNFNFKSEKSASALLAALNQVITN